MEQFLENAHFIMEHVLFLLMLIMINTQHQQKSTLILHYQTNVLINKPIVKYRTQQLEPHAALLLQNRIALLIVIANLHHLML